MEPLTSQKAGVPTVYGSPWQDGAAAIFQFLRRSAKQVIFISDTPYLRQSAADCVTGHLSDVRPCATKRRDSTVLPAIKAAELRIAKQEQINTIDPASWFCAPKACPVIVGNILVYRDTSHMTPQWSRFIAPVLDNAIQRTVAAASATHRRRRSTQRPFRPPG
jgi:hypothetical protein